VDISTLANLVNAFVVTGSGGSTMQKFFVAIIAFGAVAFMAVADDES